MISKTMKLLTALLILVHSKSWSQTLPALNKEMRTDITDSLVSALLNNYVYPEKAKSMSFYIKSQLGKGAYDTLINPDHFANIVTNDVRSIYPDKHLIIRYDPGLEKRIMAFNNTNKIDSVDIKREQKQNFFFKKAEILPGNTGYIVFTNFADTNQWSRKTVRTAMQFVAYTDALILDLRNNFGGNATMAGEIISYFYNQPTFTGRAYNRITNTWTEQWADNKPAITTGIYMSMPLYILTSERTFSAAEGLAYNLQQIKKAIIIGDTTRGGAHATRSFALGHGFVGFIPFTRSENAITKTDWEDRGVIPDIAVNEDSALLKAQEQIYLEDLSKAKGDEEKNKFKWLINDLKTKTLKLVIPASALKQYTGQYEEFVFTLRKKELYCTNTHQKAKTDKLTPITTTLFKIDEQSQVEFIKDDKGKFSGIKLYWNDGWVDSIKKNK